MVIDFVYDLANLLRCQYDILILYGLVEPYRNFKDLAFWMN